MITASSGSLVVASPPTPVTKRCATYVEKHPIAPNERARSNATQMRYCLLHLGELFELDALAADCASDGVYEFLFVLSPMPVVNGSGSPVNPIAFK